MDGEGSDKVFDVPHLRDKVGVFADRAEAGEVLADMLHKADLGASIVLAIPAGGVPVGAVIARRLHLPLDLAVVSKITPLSNSEVGYGAVAWDGTVLLNEPLRRRMGLDDEEVRRGTAVARQKVLRRMGLLRRSRPMPDLSDAVAILVDDGVASGFTTRCAVAALEHFSAARVILATPTAHAESLEGLASHVWAIYCPNIRHGWSYAVADAYQHWTDVSDRQAADVLSAFEADRR